MHDLLNTTAYHAQTIDDIQVVTIVEVDIHYIKDRPETLTFLSVTYPDGRTYMPPYPLEHENNFLYLTLEEAKQAIFNSIKFRREQAKDSYERELERLQEAEDKIKNYGEANT